MSSFCVASRCRALARWAVIACSKEEQLIVSRVLPPRIRQYGLACGLLMLVALVVVAGCGSGRVVLPITIDPQTQMVPTDSRDLTNHERAVQGIARTRTRKPNNGFLSQP